MAVAFFVTHGGALVGEGNGEQAYTYLVFAVALVFSGAGRYSLDALVNRRTTTYA